MGSDGCAQSASKGMEVTSGERQAITPRKKAPSPPTKKSRRERIRDGKGGSQRARTAREHAENPAKGGKKEGVGEKKERREREGRGEAGDREKRRGTGMGGKAEGKGK